MAPATCSARFTIIAALAILGAVFADQFPHDWKPDVEAWGSFPDVPHNSWDLVQPTVASKRSPVSSKALQSHINKDNLFRHAENFQAIAYSHPGRNRLFGTLGHNFTALYIYKHLEKLSDYYYLGWQPFTQIWVDYKVGFEVKGKGHYTGRMLYSPAGQVEAPLQAILAGGCKRDDFPPDLRGRIALIPRGGCDYGLKAALAGAAHAAGVVLYNSEGGDEGLYGTLGVRARAEGPYPPTVAISQNAGIALLEALAKQPPPPAGAATNASRRAAVTGRLTVVGGTEDRVTMNLFAQTKGGDQNNVLMLGAHADSVAEGPGINDNAAGVSDLLEVALALEKYNVSNAVRFAWWSAEEYGLAGSYHYVRAAAAAELAKIRLYLNFDVIASPNFMLAVYDGNGNNPPPPAKRKKRGPRRLNERKTAWVTGPPGSGAAEDLLKAFISSIGEWSETVTFNNRSDYQAFLDAGIPTSGPFTGAEGMKSSPEVSYFGGMGNQPYDPNYHKKGDTVDNLNMRPFLANTKATAHAVATFATSFDTLGTRRTARKRSSMLTHALSHAHGCQQHGHEEESSS